MVDAMPSGEPNLVYGEASRISAAPGSWIIASLGVVAALLAWEFDRSAARSSVAQVWSPFVLVAGLLLVGLVADQDGLFALAGHRLATLAPNGAALFAGAAVITATVTALLNLDTSVVFLTPVLVHAARSRGQEEAPLLIGCILLSNAGSLLLPGSNLTNLIVVGHLRLSGGQFLTRMALPWTASIVLTAAVIAVAGRRSLRTDGSRPMRQGDVRTEPVAVGLGAVAVVASTVLVMVFPSPALPVATVGVVAVAVRAVAGRVRAEQVRSVVGAPVLVGLFGVATALGALGRAWSGPAALLAHLDAPGTAAVAAGSSVLVNNLPAAALLAARVPPHPFALLVGLDIGPNLFMSGSLAWILWLRAARMSGANPPTRRAIVLGLVTVPVSIGAALAVLSLTGSP